jgi:flagellar hook-associated protein 2
MNEGARLTANAAYEGNSGVNRIAIETRGETTQISVNVREGDTNRDVQQRMADAINNAGIGIRASVETNSETNASMLRLESTTTGSDPRSSFTISDVSGDLVAQTGAADMARGGQDAIYSVNGGAERRSQSNTVFIGNGVTATFNSASEEAVRITWGRDTSVDRSAIEDMVSSYNSLFSAAAERTSDPRAQNLASRMLGVSRTYSNSLSNIGIGFDSSGRMTIDSKRMDQAEESGRLSQFFTQDQGRNFGFTNQLGRLADSVSRNPGSFMSSSMFLSELMGNSGYTSFGNPTQFNFFAPGSAFDFML